jgi:hypothetical protein
MTRASEALLLVIAVNHSNASPLTERIHAPETQRTDTERRNTHFSLEVRYRHDQNPRGERPGSIQAHSISNGVRIPTGYFTARKSCKLMKAMNSAKRQPSP